MKVSALDCRAFIHDSKMFRHADGSMQSFLPTPNPYAEVWTGAMLQLLLMAFADSPYQMLAGCTLEMDQADSALSRQ